MQRDIHRFSRIGHELSSGARVSLQLAAVHSASIDEIDRRPAT
jgi:hypothetical protein